MIEKLPAASFPNNASWMSFLSDTVSSMFGNTAATFKSVYSKVFARTHFSTVTFLKKKETHQAKEMQKRR